MNIFHLQHIFTQKSTSQSLFGAQSPSVFLEPERENEKCHASVNACEKPLSLSDNSFVSFLVLNGS